MAKIIGVRFRNSGKVYYFNPGRYIIKAGSGVIVETVQGVEFGEVSIGTKEVPDEEIVAPLKEIIRVASPKDYEQLEENKNKEQKAFETASRKIAEHKLDMKLVGVEQTFDNAKILFYFTANGRVDFRSLVKDLASVFHTRIELRQIGVRDEAKMLGGLGPCGRPICCGAFLGDFQPVSIKMAKEQNLSLNPTKISGVCGRLMCCLKFEQDHYESTRKRMPKTGKEVETPDGVGTVTDLNVLKETVTVRLHKGDSVEFKTYPLEELKWNKPVPQPAAEGRTQEGKAQEGGRSARGQGRRSRQNRTPLATDPSGPAPVMPAEADELPPEVTEERSDEGEGDWLKAVEDALKAAQEKE